MLQKTKSGYYTFSSFLQFPELVCGISSKGFGNMKVSDVSSGSNKLKTGEKREQEKLEEFFKEEAYVSQNRALFASILGIGHDRFVFMDQLHQSFVYQVFSYDANRFIQGADGLVTNENNLFLFAAVADCFPILVYDPVRKVVGIAHAGWRGVRGGIGRNLIVQMQTLGSKPSDLIVGIGPGICGRCYEVGQDVASQFPQRFLTIRHGKIFLDLEGIICEQLTTSGIKIENLDFSKTCVFEDESFFSVRREQHTGRIAAVIGMR